MASGDFFAELLAPRAWHVFNLERHTRKFLIGFKVPLAAVLLLLIGNWRPERSVTLLGAYVATAFLAGLGFSGGDGVSFNIYLDTTVALALGIGLALSRWRHLDEISGWRSALCTILPVLLLSPLVTRVGDPLTRLRVLGSEGAPVASAAADFARDKAILEGRPGLAICESLLLCFAAGKSLSLDPFNAYEAFTAGRADETALLESVARGAYGTIELRAAISFRSDGAGGRTIDLNPPIRFTERFYVAVATRYQVIAENSAGVIYVPR